MPLIEDLPLTKNKLLFKKKILPATLRNYVSSILILLVLLVWAWIIWDKNDNNVILVQKSMQLNSVNSQKDTLQNSFIELISRYDSLKTIFLAEQQIVVLKDAAIAEKQARIKEIFYKSNASTQEILELKYLLSSFNLQVESYKKNVQHEDLDNLASQVPVQNLSVTPQTKNVDSLKIHAKNKEKVDGSDAILHASNFTILSVKDKKNGKQVATNVAKRVSKLLITFTLDKSVLAKSGSKELYVFLTSPDGTSVPFTDSSKNGSTSKEVFTKRVKVNFKQGHSQKVSLDWKQNANFKSGTYKVDVFQKGVLIGTGMCKLRRGGWFS